MEKSTTYTRSAMRVNVDVYATKLKTSREIQELDVLYFAKPTRLLVYMA
jgi:hypothetical protein